MFPCFLNEKKCYFAVIATDCSAAQVKFPKVLINSHHPSETNKQNFWQKNRHRFTDVVSFQSSVLTSA